MAVSAHHLLVQWVLVASVSRAASLVRTELILHAGVPMGYGDGQEVNVINYTYLIQNVIHMLLALAA
jgi:hypothetical protein